MNLPDVDDVIQRLKKHPFKTGRSIVCLVIIILVLQFVKTYVNEKAKQTASLRRNEISQETNEEKKEFPISYREKDLEETPNSSKDNNQVSKKIHRSTSQADSSNNNSLRFNSHEKSTSDKPSGSSIASEEPRIEPVIPGKEVTGTEVIWK